MQRHDYSARAAVEDHTIGPEPSATYEFDAWLLGTTFDIRTRVSRVNPLEARYLAGGPVARATPAYLLPCGFHGNFTAT